MLVTSPYYRGQRKSGLVSGGVIIDTMVALPPLPAEPSPSETRGWYAVAVLLIVLLLSFTDRFIINLVVDPIRAYLLLTDFQISLLQGVGFAVIFALAGLPCGRLADRVVQS